MIGHFHFPTFHFLGDFTLAWTCCHFSYSSWADGWTERTGQDRNFFWSLYFASKLSSSGSKSKNMQIREPRLWRGRWWRKWLGRRRGWNGRRWKSTTKKRRSSLCWRLIASNFWAWIFKHFWQIHFSCHVMSISFFSTKYMRWYLSIQYLPHKMYKNSTHNEFDHQIKLLKLKNLEFFGKVRVFIPK